MMKSDDKQPLLSGSQSEKDSLDAPPGLFTLFGDGC